MFLKNISRCRSGACIPGHLQCSGHPECDDESDEAECGEGLNHYFYLLFYFTMAMSIFIF